jgi:hypothetical protein
MTRKSRSTAGQLKASLAKSREAVDVAAKLDTAQLKPQLDKLKADLKAITLTKASIAVDSAQATAKLKTLRAELNGLREKVKVDADTAGIKERIAAVKAEIASVGNQKATLNVDTAAASAHITALSAQLSAFGGQDFTAHVNVDGGKGGIGVRLAGIADGFADIGSKMSTVMTVAGVVQGQPSASRSRLTSRSTRTSRRRSLSMRGSLLSDRPRLLRHEPPSRGRPRGPPPTRLRAVG